MSDPLKTLFRERFSGHEVDVPDGAWEHIQGQLSAGGGTEALRETMQRKFNAHEVDVDPSAWAHISGQLGHGAVAGTSFGTAWLAAGVGAVAITAGLLWWNATDKVPLAQATGQTSTAPSRDPAMVHQPVPEPEEAMVVSGTSATIPAPGTGAAKQATLPMAAEQIHNDQVTGSVESAPEGLHDPGKVTQAASGAGMAAPPQEKQLPQQNTEVAQAQQGPVAVQHEPQTQPAPTKPQPAPGQEGGLVQPEQPASGLPEKPAHDPFANEAENDIFIPNVFSPQGDGVNDKLKIVANGYARAEVRVVSAKTGTLVFESNDLGNMWDGRLANGNIAEEGYYRCVVLLTDAAGHTHVKTEVVRLYR